MSVQEIELPILTARCLLPKDKVLTMAKDIAASESSGGFRLTLAFDENHENATVLTFQTTPTKGKIAMKGMGAGEGALRFIVQVEEGELEGEIVVVGAVDPSTIHVTQEKFLFIPLGPKRIIGAEVLESFLRQLRSDIERADPQAGVKLE